MKLNELNLNQVLGDFGSAAMKQAGNRLTGNAEGDLSVKDRMAKDKFIADFVGRANTNLSSAIQSGLVDPNIKADPTGGVTTPIPQTPTLPAQDTGEPKTPEQIRKEKQAAAGQVAQDQMKNNPAPAKPEAPKTPEQIRQEKQAAATQTAQGQMAANPAPTQPTSTVAPQTPEQIRQAKQAAAAQTAQNQMGPQGQPVARPTTAPAPTGLGNAGNIRPGAPQPDPKAQQAALKAKIQGDRAAGTNLAAQTGSGFNDYVAGGKGFTAGPNGEPVQKVARESIELYSRFLGRVL